MYGLEGDFQMNTKSKFLNKSQKHPKIYIVIQIWFLFYKFFLLLSKKGNKISEKRTGEFNDEKFI